MEIHWDKIYNDSKKKPKKPPVSDYCSFANYFLLHRGININCLKEKKKVFWRTQADFIEESEI